MSFILLLDWPPLEVLLYPSRQLECAALVRDRTILRKPALWVFTRMSSGEPGMRCGVCFLHNEADEQLWNADQWVQRYLAYSAQQGYGSLRNGAM